MTSKISLHGDKWTPRQFTHSKRTTERRSSLTFLCRRASRPRVCTQPLPRPHTPEPTASLRSTAAAETAEPKPQSFPRTRRLGLAPPTAEHREQSSAALERPVEKGRAWRASPLSRFREPGPASGYSRCCSRLRTWCKVRTAGWERATLPAERRAPGRQEADMAVRGGAEGR